MHNRSIFGVILIFILVLVSSVSADNVCNDNYSQYSVINLTFSEDLINSPFYLRLNTVGYNVGSNCEALRLYNSSCGLIPYFYESNCNTNITNLYLSATTSNKNMLVYAYYLNKTSQFSVSNISGVFGSNLVRLYTGHNNSLEDFKSGYNLTRTGTNSPGRDKNGFYGNALISNETGIYYTASDSGIPMGASAKRSIFMWLETIAGSNNRPYIGLGTCDTNKLYQIDGWNSGGSSLAYNFYGPQSYIRSIGFKTWQRVALVQNSSDSYFSYFNGTYNGVYTTPVNAQSNGNFYIGSSACGGGTNAVYSEVMIYNDTKNATEAKRLSGPSVYPFISYGQNVSITSTTTTTTTTLSPPHGGGNEQGAVTQWSQVFWYVAETIAHSIHYGIYNSSISCDQTHLFYVNGVVGIDNKINTSTDKYGTYHCQNSTQGVIIISNDGSVNIGINSSFSNVPTGIKMKFGHTTDAWKSSCGGFCNSTSCDLSSDCLLVNITPVRLAYSIPQNGSKEYWMWADFFNVAGTVDPVKGNMTTEAYMSV